MFAIVKLPGEKSSAEHDALLHLLQARHYEELFAPTKPFERHLDRQAEPPPMDAAMLFAPYAVQSLTLPLTPASAAETCPTPPLAVGVSPPQPLLNFCCCFCQYNDASRDVVQMHMLGHRRAAELDAPKAARSPAAAPVFGGELMRQQYDNALLAVSGVHSAFDGAVVEPFLPAGATASRDALSRRCQICGKNLNPAKPLSSLLNHAKRHYLLKQFICTDCPYSSSEAAHVRNHMRLRHQITERPPLDNRNPLLQSAWIRITARCFPAMSHELRRFRFKNFRKKPTGRQRSGSDTSGRAAPPADDAAHRSASTDA